LELRVAGGNTTKPTAAGRSTGSPIDRGCDRAQDRQPAEKLPAWARGSLRSGDRSCLPCRLVLFYRYLSICQCMTTDRWEVFGDTTFCDVIGCTPQAVVLGVVGRTVQRVSSFAASVRQVRGCSLPPSGPQASLFSYQYMANTEVRRTLVQHQTWVRRTKIRNDFIGAL
jgi:hypothetical protein